jgi:hypothetical protein
LSVKRVSPKRRGKGQTIKWLRFEQTKVLIVYFGRFYESYRSSPDFWATFSHWESYVLILTKMGLATFWAIFYLQSHLVTMAAYSLSSE